MAATVALTAEYARDCFDYAPETGKVTWRRRPREHFKRNRAYLMWNTRFALQEAGWLQPDGYINVGVNRAKHKLHRVVWLMMKGEWPKDQIDHINHIRTDNRWANLRETTNLENGRNQGKPVNNTSGVTGVSWHKQRKKWTAYINVNGHKYHLGIFTNIQDASNAVASAYKTNDFHANHGV